MNKAMLLEY